MPGRYIKGFAIDDTKVDKTFASRLPKEKLLAAYLILVNMARDDGFDVVLGERTGHTSSIPYVLVFATGNDKDQLDATPIEKRESRWLEPFLEEEAGVFLRY
jgi:hypothetical protein